MGIITRWAGLKMLGWFGCSLSGRLEASSPVPLVIVKGAVPLGFVVGFSGYRVYETDGAGLDAVILRASAGGQAVEVMTSEKLSWCNTWWKHAGQSVQAVTFVWKDGSLLDGIRAEGFPFISVRTLAVPAVGAIVFRSHAACDTVQRYEV